MNWQSIWGAFTSRVSQPFKENLDMKTVSSGPDVEAGTLKRPSTWQDFEQPRYSRRETILTMIGVLLVMLLASLDQTIVSTECHGLLLIYRALTATRGSPRL